MEFILPESAKEIPAREDKIYELIIIGAGPAGMTAAVYSARKKIDTLLISKDIGGQVLTTSWIENYMGYQYITGQELIRKFQEQVAQFPIALAIGENVRKINIEKDHFLILTESNKKFQSTALIIASGKKSRPLNVPGEKELVGRGISYCATCDAPLFKDREVAVVGGGNSALTAVIDLLNYAARIYVVNILASLQADEILIERVKNANKVEFFLGYEVKEIKGNNLVESILIKSRDTNIEKVLPVSGVFIEIGLIPNSEFVKDIVALNQAQEIIVNCKCETNIPGIFAAGDVTSVPDKQIIIAAGEGAKAALSAYKYLINLKKKQ